jgi:hypothetical protein
MHEDRKEISKGRTDGGKESEVKRRTITVS